jgi:hypothetical protein
MDQIKYDDGYPPGADREKGSGEAGPEKERQVGKLKTRPGRGLEIAASFHKDYSNLLSSDISTRPYPSDHILSL